MEPVAASPKGPVNLWTDPEHAGQYLARADRLPHRQEGERVLVGDLEICAPTRVLDLGCGDGRLIALVLAAYPEATAVGIDFSPTMLAAAAHRFRDDRRVDLIAADLDHGLPVRGAFDCVVSSLAIHHVTDLRKRSLFREVAARLRPGGIFCNLDIVASPTRALHDRWRDEMQARDDPSDHLRDLASQLDWLREAGLHDVDCIWKWRSLALMRGEQPA